MKRSKPAEVNSVIARVEKDFRSKRKSTSFPGGRMTSSSQGRETSPQRKNSSNKNKTDWFGPQPLGQRKRPRPFSANAPMEVKFTSFHARGPWSFHRPSNRKRIQTLLRSEAVRSSVLVRRVSLEGEGVLLIRLETKKREDLSRFLRVLAGRIPRAVTGAERGRPFRAPGFWNGLVSSRCLPVSKR